GNYNSARYARLFFTRLRALNPTDIVVQYFLRDAEVLSPGNDNWFLRHSQIAVVLWNAMGRLARDPSKNNLETHYRQAYEPSSEGYRAMEEALKSLSEYAAQRKIRLTLAM